MSLLQGVEKPKYKESLIVNHRKQWVPIAVKDVALFNKESILYLYTFEGEKYALILKRWMNWRH